ncbi:methionyl-tRNA formyltransferase [Candidatus Uhrbacteria bacterium]|nr:methionyl-tRNA formyltransferase [Candidatus Uhrbacteria bacterium]
MRIVFFGTPDWACVFLRALHADPDIEVAAVVTPPDSPVGRRQVLTPCPVKEEAERLGIEAFQPPTLRKSLAVVEKLKSYGADAFVVISYGKILPQAVLEIPRLGCMNVHPSLLPTYRGATPMPAAIAAGDMETAITLMLLDAGMDTGPILASLPLPLASDETLRSLEQKVTDAGPYFLLKTLKAYTAGEIRPIPQDDAKATYTKLLSREDARIDWNKSAEVVERRMRAFDPWPGSWTLWNRRGKPLRLKILKAVVAPGTVKTLSGTASVGAGNELIVACGEGSLRILLLQPEGKTPMDAATFLRGYSDINGETLG